MRTFIDKNDVIAKILITDYLGFQLDRDYLSPLRPDRNPSFHVFIGRNGNQMWIDNGTKQSGDVIKLHMLMVGCDFNTACGELMARDRFSMPAFTPAPEKMYMKASSAEVAAKYGIRSDRPIASSRYIQYTHLPAPGWLCESFNLFVDTQANLCLPMAKGSVHCKGGFLSSKKRTFALNVGASTISVGGNQNSSEWVIVEGIGDLLALIDGALDIKHQPGQYGYIVLNSTNHYKEAIRFLQKKSPSVVNVFFDVGDPKVDSHFVDIQSALPCATDCRSLINVGKDIRDCWNAIHRPGL